MIYILFGASLVLICVLVAMLDDRDRQLENLNKRNNYTRN